jgi:hypothetical protein
MRMHPSYANGEQSWQEPRIVLPVDGLELASIATGTALTVAQGATVAAGDLGEAITKPYGNSHDHLKALVGAASTESLQAGTTFEHAGRRTHVSEARKGGRAVVALSLDPPTSHHILIGLRKMGAMGAPEGTLDPNYFPDVTADKAQEARQAVHRLGLI